MKPAIPAFLCLFACLFTDNAVSQTLATEELTLDSAVALALHNNRGIRMGQLEVLKAGDRVAVARTYRLPQMSVATYGMQLLTPLSFLFEKGAFGTFADTGPVPATDTKITTPRRPITFVVGSVAQPLTQLPRINLSIQLSELSRQIAEMHVRSQRQTLVNGVKKLYFGMVQAQASLEALEQGQKALNELDRVVGEYVVQQVALKSESMEVKGKLLGTELAALQLRNGLQSGQEQMNQLLGRDVRTLFKVVALPEADPVEQDLAAAQNAAIQKRPDLGEARLKLKQAELDLRSKKSEYIPEVNLTFLYISPFAVNVLPKNIASAGISLNWTPFDWGRRRQEMNEKSRTIEQARTNITESESAALVDVGSALRKLQESRLKVRIAKHNRDTANEYLRISTNQYKEKAALLKDVLQKQAALADSNSQYQEALLAFWTAKADFERAIGDDR